MSIRFVATVSHNSWVGPYLHRHRVVRRAEKAVQAGRKSCSSPKSYIDELSLHFSEMDRWLQSCVAELDLLSSQACNPLFSCRVCDSKTKPCVINTERKLSQASSKDKDVWMRPGFQRVGEIRKGSIHSVSTAATKQKEKSLSNSPLLEKGLSLSEPVRK